MNKEKKFNIFSILHRAVKDWWKMDKIVFLMIFFFIIAATAEPFLSIFLPKISIGVLETAGDDVAKKLIITLAVWFAVSSLIKYLVIKLDNVIKARNMADRIMLMPAGLGKMMKIDYRYTEDSNFLNEYQKGLEAIGGDAYGFEALYNSLYTIIPQILSTILMIVMTSELNPVIIAALVVHTAVTVLVSYNNQQYRYKYKKEESELNRKTKYYENVSSDFTAGKDIRIFNLGQRILDNFKIEIDNYVKLIKKFTRHDFLMNLICLLTLLATNVIMYGILIRQTINGMTISSFTMYIALINTLQNYLTLISDKVTHIFHDCQLIGDFYSLMDKKLNNTDGVDFKTEDTLEIVFDNVSFKYPGTDRYVIKNLNLKISKGERLAIVGINGAGKSTIVKLMTGLFAPTEGHIYINGVDITTIKTSSLHEQFSAVFQDVNIFAFDVEQNVACTDHDINHDRVNEALQKVNMYNKVQSLPGKEKQMLLKVIDENGTDFSGGERQKISIARGLYKDAPMVIMDEPTAALDALAEADIYQNFSDMVQGKTAVYISHRLASTKFCDKIALFSKDGLIEYGTHDELLAKKGEYYKMFVVQGKYYQEKAV